MVSTIITFLSGKTYSLFLKIYGSILYSQPVFSFLNKQTPQTQGVGTERLNNLEKKIVSEVKKYGISSTALSDLFPEINADEYLSHYKKQLSSYLEKNSTTKNSSQKHFLFRFPYNSDSLKPLNSEGPFEKLVAGLKIKKIVDSVFDIPLKLMNVNNWYAIPTTKHPVLSQNWHRDWDDPYLIKIFIYLEDVNSDDGPFYYIKESHDRGFLGHILRRYPITGRYVDEKTILSKFDADNIFECTEKKGTVIFCDTSGFHKGGLITKDNHSRYTNYAMFTSHLSDHPFRPRKVRRNFI